MSALLPAPSGAELRHPAREYGIQFHGPDAHEIIHIELRLGGSLASRLKAEDLKRGREPVELLADLIETVITDDLFTAVLDA